MWTLNWDGATLSLKPCGLQKLIPNHRFSFCCFWHCQSSDPPVHPLITGHHWDSTSLVWILSHWQVLRGDLGRGGIQSTSIGHWGSSGIGSWTPPLLHIHYITGSHHTGTWHLLPLLCWWHTALSLISTWWSNGSCTDLRLPGGHLGMDKRTSPIAQPGKDWASCLPGHSNSTAWFYHPARFFYNYPINLSQKSWGNFRKLTFKDHIAKTARSCRFALHNIRKIRAFLTQHAAQLLVQALVISWLDYCNALLAGLPSSTIKPLQMIQNAVARLVFNEPKRARHTFLCLPALAPGCSSYQVQDTDACI